MKPDNRYLILAADAHIKEKTTEKVFFRFLSLVSVLPDDCAIVFLGDIFDLWLALPGYETIGQKRFLAWCRKEKSHRDVCFVEGNHEFFVVSRRGEMFTEASEFGLNTGTLHLQHGDMINGKDHAYSFLRLMLRNPISELVIRAAAPGGVGPAVAWKIRYSLRHLNQSQKKYFPEAEARKRIDEAGEAGIRRMIAGHFHKEQHLATKDCRLDALPPFLNDGEIGVYSTESDVLTTGPFERILNQIRRREI